MKRLLLGLALLLLSPAAALATNCPAFTYTLTNGTTADANQVMANFNTLLTCSNSNLAHNGANSDITSLSGLTTPLSVAQGGTAASSAGGTAVDNISGFNATGVVQRTGSNTYAPIPLRSYLAGLLLSNDGSTPNTVIDTSAGIAETDDNSFLMTLSAFTKTTGSWAVGSGNGCLDTGSVGASTWYSLFVIERTDTAVVDELCSTSATSPSMPANYTKKRRIGSFKTDASSHIIAFIQDGDDFWWKQPFTPDSGFNQSNPGNTLQTVTLADVPTGVVVKAVLQVVAQQADGAGTVFAYVSDLATTNLAPASSFTDLAQVETAADSVAIAGGRVTVRTNTSAQIGSRVSFSNGNTTLLGNVLGWTDTRGRNL